MFRQHEDISTFPIEILFNIFSYLSPEILREISMVCTAFNTILPLREETINKGNLLWRHQFARRFPYFFKNTESKDNWYGLFREAYQAECEGLPARTIKLFSLVSEGDIAGLKKISFQLEDLNLRNSQGLLLFDFVDQINNPKVWNYIYALLAEQYPLGKIVDVQKADDEGITLLHWALTCRQPVKKNKLLIIMGADVNAVNEINAAPLTISALNGDVEMVNLLLARGAELDVVNDLGETSLFLAAQEGHVEIVKALLAKYADVNKANKDGITPLYAAAENGYHEIVQDLLKHNANVNAAHFAGATPLFAAAQYGHIEVIKILLLNKNINPSLPFLGRVSGLIEFAEKFNVAAAMIHFIETKVRDANLNAIIPITPKEIAEIMGHHQIVRLFEQKSGLLTDSISLFARKKFDHLIELKKENANQAQPPRMTALD